MITEDKINDLIDEAINQLSDDNPNFGAESLQDLAQIFAKAGLTKESFMNIRHYIVNEAIQRTDAVFIKEKLSIAEQQLQGARNGTNTTIIH